ncbi:MAG: permease-like cell division protein FtsX, partial [Acetivibrio ethanolgignens]
QGVKNIHRNRMFSLASMGTITACLFMFGIFYFLLANFQFMIKNAESSVGVTVFFDEGVEQAGIDTIGDMLAARPEVEKIEFVSAEEAWERFKETNFQGEENLEESFGEDNPLADSASYEIYMNDISKQSEFVKYARGIEGVRQVNSSDTTADSLSSFNILVGYISAAIIIILLAVAVFLISTTVATGISVRKDEISIMRLIGATDYFIRAPFIVEGILIGLTGAAAPLIVLYFIYNKVIYYVQDKFGILSNILTFLDVDVIFKNLIPISLGIGVGIGFIGSYLTVRKHLRV